MADGVAPGDVYKTLGSSDGVDRAFRKLDQLKPYIVWWQTAADAAKILGSGDVLMTTTPSSVIAMANKVEKRNFGVQFTGSLYEPRSWVIMKGDQNLHEAQQFLYLTGLSSLQARLFRLCGEIGLAKGVTDWLPRISRLWRRPLRPIPAWRCGSTMRSGVTIWRSYAPGSIPGLRRNKCRPERQVNQRKELKKKAFFF